MEKYKIDIFVLFLVVFDIDIKWILNYKIIVYKKYISFRKFSGIVIKLENTTNSELLACLLFILVDAMHVFKWNHCFYLKGTIL